MSTLGALFDAVAATYDAERRLLIPEFDAFYGAAVVAAGPLAPGSRVLDLGAGTGLFAGLVAAANPGIRCTLVDLAPAMLREAEGRFARLGSAVETVVADYAEALPQGPFDAVISALSIHHLDHAVQRGLFRRVADVLEPGRRFINAEQIEAADAEGAEARWDAAIRALGATDAMVVAARARMAHDRCAPPEAVQAWLREAGFASDMPWSGGRFAVFCAVRL